MRDLHCRGCGRLVGRTPQPRSLPVYCTDPFCVLVPSATDNDTRDGLVTLLLANDVAPQALATALGISRQYVHTIGRAS